MNSLACRGQPLHFVKSKWRSLQQQILVGHSTGCQDIVHYLRHGSERTAINGFVLQAPVSDREAMYWFAQSSASEDRTDTLIDAIARADVMIAEGRGEELMPRDCIGCECIPTTARRFASLSGRLTTEDMFSSDLTDSELLSQLGHVQDSSVEMYVVVSDVPCFVFWFEVYLLEHILTRICYLLHATSRHGSGLLV